MDDFEFECGEPSRKNDPLQSARYKTKKLEASQLQGVLDQRCADNFQCVFRKPFSKRCRAKDHPSGTSHGRIQHVYSRGSVP